MPIDNSMAAAKAALRTRFLPDHARVLDLFCGNGEMYRRVYQGKAEEYQGVDNSKIHDPVCCLLMDNLRYVRTADLARFNVFDLDTYGCPWNLFYLLLKRLIGGEITVYMTDGLTAHMMRDGNVTRFVSGTEQVPKNFNMPGIVRWYTDIFATMLLDIERRLGWKTREAWYLPNHRLTVHYWAIKLTKEISETPH